MGHQFGRLTVYSELGYFWNQQRPNEWLYGIAAEYEINDQVSIMGEFHGTARYPFSEDELISNLGSRWRFNKRISFLVSVGRAIRSPGPAEPGFLSYVALQLVL
jgi:hypothetical protein